MHSYPKNSPQAAARVLALALLADGDLSPREINVLVRLNTPQALGIELASLYSVFQTYCEDLLCSSRLTWCDACRVDRPTMHLMLDEIDDPQLQRAVLQLCMAAVVADELTTEAEADVIEVVAQRWGLQFLRSPGPVSEC
jgi:hypothetical protein